MQNLFVPAVALMNRLRYPSKFLLLGAAVLSIILTLLFLVFSHLNSNIEVAEHEINGVQMLKPMNRAVQNLQTHRGLSAGFLGGNDGMKEKREAREKASTEMI